MEDLTCVVKKSTLLSTQVMLPSLGCQSLELDLTRSQLNLSKNL